MDNPFSFILQSTASGRSVGDVSCFDNFTNSENIPASGVNSISQSTSSEHLASLCETPTKNTNRKVSMTGKCSSPATQIVTSTKKLARPSSFRLIDSPACKTPQKQATNPIGRCRSSSKETKPLAPFPTILAATAKHTAPACKTLDKALFAKNNNAPTISANKNAILAKQRAAVRKIRTQRDSTGFSASASASEEEVDMVKRRQSMAITAEIRNLVQRATEEHEASEQQPEQALVDEVEQEQDPAPLDAPCLESNSPSAPASRSRQSMDMSRKRESLVLDSALISKMLPRKVCLHVRQGKPVPPEFFSNVSIFFSDVVGFTNISAAVEPIQVIRLLNTLFTVMDYVTSLFPLYKVETIGDAYMVASGLPEPNEENAQALADFAILVSNAVNVVKSPLDGTPIRIRMGMHSGDVMAGVVGSMMPRYCLFGDTVNTASRMESNGEPGRIHLSGAIAAQLIAGGRHVIEERGEIEVKGKGLMRTYWLIGASETNDVSDADSINRVVEYSRELVQNSYAFGMDDEDQE